MAQDSAAIEAEDEVYAFADAQAKLEETASQDTALLASAQQQASSCWRTISPISGKRQENPIRLNGFIWTKIMSPLDRSRQIPGQWKNRRAPAEGQ